MPRPNRSPAKKTRDGNDYLKMKQLSDKTGLPKSTILHYVKEGLLPKPHKTGTNMAYYHPSCIERIRLIKQLQLRHRLSLSAIGDILSRSNLADEVIVMAELHDVIFGPENENTLNLDEFCKATGLTRQEVENNMKSGILMPLADGKFDAEDVTIGKVIKSSISLGLTAEDTAFYTEFAEKIAVHEMTVRNRLTSGLPNEEKVAVTIELTKLARSTRAYVIDRMFQHKIMAKNRKLSKSVKN